MEIKNPRYQGLVVQSTVSITLLHSEQPKLPRVLSAVGLMEVFSQGFDKSYCIDKMKHANFFFQKNLRSVSFGLKIQLRHRS